MKIRTNIVAVLAALSCSFSIGADELSEISDYREYSATFASSGQPTKEQLQFLKDDGFERIVYIAFSDNGNAFADEDVVVKELGMDYVHIPVIWDSPTASDFYSFAAVGLRAYSGHLG